MQLRNNFFHFPSVSFSSVCLVVSDGRTMSPGYVFVAFEKPETDLKS